MDKDQYDEQAERLLPCSCDGAYFNGNKWIKHHPITCAARYRPAVAAALREAGKREAELQQRIRILENPR